MISDTTRTSFRLSLRVRNAVARHCCLFAAALLGLLLVADRVQAQSGSIEIMKVDGLTAPGPVVFSRAPVRLVLRFTNNTPNKVDCSNGWRVSSPDGAVWSSVTLDSIGPNTAGENVFGAYFDIVFYVRRTSALPGPPADTVGWLGAGSPINAYRQLPAGYNDSALALTINFPADQWEQNEGKHVCVDSSFWGAGGEWKWAAMVGTSVVEYSPQFLGYSGQTYTAGSGYCFALTGQEPCYPYITRITEKAAAPPIPPPPVVLTGSHCDTFTYDFDCYDCGYGGIAFAQIDGPGQIDTTTGVWTYQPLGLSDVGTKTVTVTCRDNSGRTSAPRSITVEVTNARPEITSACSAINGAKGGQTDFQVTADSKDCDRMYWAAKITLGDTTSVCVIDSTGTVHFTPNSVGSYNIRVIASDSAIGDTCVVSAWVILPSTCCQGTTGNVDQAGIIDVSDLSLLVAYLTTGNIPLFCPQAANVNGAGIIDVSDLSLLVAYLTAPAIVLPDCPHQGYQESPREPSSLER